LVDVSDTRPKPIPRIIPEYQECSRTNIAKAPTRIIDPINA